MANKGGGARKLRTKERKVYADNEDADEEIEGARNFNLEEKLSSRSYNAKFVKLLKGNEVTLEYVQKNGLTEPLLVMDKSGLGMRVPSQNFTVADVKQCVGSRRTLDVMDVNTQQALEMNMKDWVKYYENPERDRLLNVISLEFSHTKLDHYVEQPNVVKQLDWVETVWPRYLKECQTETTNIIEKMKYPKVQKYCLMSVRGCYTDFHIDFGGTSVWYHILHGKKIFWLIPPTEENLDMYETWTKSGKQGDVFFADQVKDCQRIELNEGVTFFIPTGWIHAVYTPKDSLVFGGNFIHSFSIPMQLNVAAIENKTYVPTKFKYPFFGEMLWYVMERYISVLTGKHHRRKSEEEVQEEEEYKQAKEAKKGFMDGVKKEDIDSYCSDDTKSSGSRRTDFSPPRSPIMEEHSYVCSPQTMSPMSVPYKSDSEESVASQDRSRSSSIASRGKCTKSQSDLIKPVSVKLEKCVIEHHGKPKKLPKRYLTHFELEGLRVLMEWIEHLAPTKKCVPHDILHPEEVLSDMKALLEEHKDDDPRLASTGEALLKWKPKKTKPKSHTQKTKSANRSKGTCNSNIRRRRTRCRKCEPCTRPECEECRFCKDMKKFGGPGRMKQCCISKQCMSPILPTLATCIICDKDGLEKNDPSSDQKLNLMECGICWEIVHPDCYRIKHPEVTNEGNVNEDLPNSWECPKCCSDGKQGQIKPRAMKGFSVRKVGNHRSSTSSEASEEKDDSGGGYRYMPKAKPEVKPKVVEVKVEPEERKRGRRSETKPKVEQRRSRSATVEKDENHGVSTRASRGVKVKREVESEEEVPRKKVKAKQETRSKSPLQPKNSRDKQVAPRTRQSSPKRQESTKSPGSSMGKTEPSSGSRKRAASPLSPRRLTSRGRETPTGFSRTKGCARITCSVGKIEPQDDYTSAITSEATNDSDSELMHWSQSGERNLTTRRTGEIKISAQLYVVRPAPGPPPPKQVRTDDGNYHPLSHELWLSIFRYLIPQDLCACMSVCCVWYQWCQQPSLWKVLDMSWRRPMSQPLLIAIVKKQPIHLNLDGTNINRQQIAWLLPRLPHMKMLSLRGNSAASVHSLCSVNCPLLHYLDISGVEVLDDLLLQQLLAPPHDHRPGVDNSSSRLRNLIELHISGTDLTDSSLKTLSVQLPKLKVLDLSYCVKITELGLESLCAKGSTLHRLLNDLDISGCNQLPKSVKKITGHIPHVTYPDF